MKNPEPPPGPEYHFRVRREGRTVAWFAGADGLNPWDRVKASATTMRSRITSRLRAGTPQAMEGSGRTVELTAGRIVEEDFDRWARGQGAGYLDLDIDLIDAKGSKESGHRVLRASALRLEGGPWEGGASAVGRLEMSCAGWDWSKDTPSHCWPAAILGGVVGAVIAAVVALILVATLVAPAGESSPRTLAEARPVALDDRLTITAEAGVRIDVLGNDRIPGSEGRIVSVSDPGHGRARIVDDEAIEYTPDPGFAGVDSFTYTLAGGGPQASATVTVEVLGVPGPPVAILDATPTAGVAPLLVAFDGSASFDPGGPLRSYALSFGDGTSLSRPGAPPARIEHVYTSAGIYRALLRVTGEAGAVAEDAIVVEATPASVVPAAFAPVTVAPLTVAPVAASPNAPPAAALSASPSFGPAPLAVTLSTAGTGDPDDGIASWRLAFGDGAEVSGTGSPPPLVPHLYAAGRYTPRLTVRDGAGAMAEARTKVKAVNRPPVARLDGTPSTGAPPLDVVFSTLGSMDPDGTIASWELSFGDGDAVAGAGSPPATIPHTYGVVGVYVAALTVVDDAGASDVARVSTSVSSSSPPPNAPPIAAADAYEVTIDVLFVEPAPGVLANDSDPDGDPLTVTLVDPPAVGDLTLSPDGGFTYLTDVGTTVSFVYEVSDGAGGTDTATVTIDPGAGSSSLALVPAESRRVERSSTAVRASTRDGGDRRAVQRAPDRRTSERTTVRTGGWTVRRTIRTR